MKQNTSQQDELADKVCKDFEEMRFNRTNFDSQWNEVAARVMPNHSRVFTSRGYQIEGDKRNQEIFDATAVIANQRFSSILDSLITPRNSTWHTLRSSDPHINKDRQVRLWFDEVTRLLFKYRYAPTANFSSQNQQNYLSIGAYGNGCVFTDEFRGGKGLRYKGIHLSEIYVAENHQGVIDKAIRYYKLRARQAYQKWGDKCPDAIIQAAKSSPEKFFEFLHCTKPNDEVDYERKDHKGMDFVSYDIAFLGKKVLDEGGYTSFPFAFSRYDQAPNETYGRGPAMLALPANKTLQEMKKTLLKQGQRIVDPVLLMHDDGVVGFSLRPGAKNQGGVTKDGKPLVHVLPTGRVDIGKELMDDERAVINDSSLVSLFQILTETPEMSATEVMERTREKGILLAPTVGRLQSEYLGPLIERELDVLAKQGLLPPMPGLLVEAKGEYTIQYDSPLNRAQRAEEASGFMRTLELALKAAVEAQNPAPLDHFNWDVIIPQIADIQGVPEEWLNSAKDIQAMRAQRSQQQQLQQATTAAPGAAAMIKAVAKSKEAQAA